ncbi:hypothetical protein J4732_06560 [Serratia marcescens]|uniref:Uncharacterized protein n=1 Tax=Serratia marcescens TaxID=615 RepID=A0A939SNJ9_SERMA|nr:hypothetical protein [Serratia marcescens]
MQRRKRRDLPRRGIRAPDRRGADIVRCLSLRLRRTSDRIGRLSAATRTG